MKTLEGLALRRLVQEIEKDIVGARIQKVTFPTDWETSLELFSSSKTFGLLVSTHPECSAVALFPSFEKGNPPKTPWQKLLHKYLVGGKIVTFKQVGWDRVIEMIIHNPGLWEKETAFVCLLELTGRNANLILTKNDAQRTILGALRPVSPEENRFRSVLPGLPYTLPPQRERHDPLRFSINPVFPETHDLAQWCVRNLDGFGPFLSMAFAELAGRFEKQNAFQRIIKPLMGECTFFVFFDHDGRPLGVFWEHVSSLPHTYSSFSSLNEAMAFLLLAFREYVLEVAQQKAREKKLKEDLDFVMREMQKIEDLLPREEDVELLRLKGELLKMLPYLEILERTEEGIRVRNPFAPSPKEIFLALPPSCPLSEVMQEYFKRYRKMRERRTKLLKAREELRARLEKIQTALSSPGYSETSSGDDEPQKTIGGITRFRTPSGNEIWVGKSARANRILVRLASRNDYWLHARDFPGAHVIVKAFSPEALEEDIEKAAQIAAYFSRGRLEGKVDVVCTQVKHLRTLAAKEGGKTTYRHEKTLRVTPSYPQDLQKV
ncbi:NFACT family protein [Candidatus Caldatribacterium sp.]|uniref:Rqc2 family fibronectin-binding protein n=1 Tax=Candidatus Caldatribacterium sp. TaxID=2282143 RepID=UPI002995C5F1|nr:NFACT family protein [Candidatus Caldatribacterium sp.]MDW8080463.1 NFACT family protein [Candidatus Calescibacterium sp.]